MAKIVKTEALLVRLTESDRKLIEQAADATDQYAATFIRAAALKAAKRLIHARKAS